MRISHKFISGTVSALPLALLMAFASTGHCTIINKAGLENQGKPVTTSMKPSGLGQAGNQAEPIAIEKQYPLTLGKSGHAQLQSVSSLWQPVAALEFALPGDAPPGSTNASRQNHEPVQTGSLTWLVSPEGTQVIDNKTGQRSIVSALTSSAVRPRDIVYDEQQGTVWLYGESVYRYRIAQRTLERLQPAQENFHAIRKAVTTPSGLWLATEKGIFWLGDNGATLKKIKQPEADGANFINAAANEKEVWFATADAHLTLITIRAPDQIEVAMSAKLLGTPAEIFVAGQKVWMLLSSHHGDHYKLAFADKTLNQVSVISGKYFSLNEKDGQLTASAYSTLYRIDPIHQTMVTLKLSEAGLLSRASHNASVLFLGSSYAYKDGCEIVEHAKLDLSKGWIDALSDFIFR